MWTGLTYPHSQKTQWSMTASASLLKWLHMNSTHVADTHPRLAQCPRTMHRPLFEVKGLSFHWNWRIADSELSLSRIRSVAYASPGRTRQPELEKPVFYSHRTGTKKQPCQFPRHASMLIEGIAYICASLHTTKMPIVFSLHAILNISMNKASYRASEFNSLPNSIQVVAKDIQVGNSFVLLHL